MSSGIFLVQVWHHITWKIDCMWLSWRKGPYLAHNSMNSNHFTWTITGIFLYSYQLPYVAKDIQRQLMAVVFCVCCIVQCQTGYPRWDERSGQQMSQKVWAWYLVIFSCLSCGLWRIPAYMLQKADLKATFHQQSIHVANDLQGRLTLPLVDKIWQHICLTQLLLSVPCNHQHCCFLDENMMWDKCKMAELARKLNQLNMISFKTILYSERWPLNKLLFSYTESAYGHISYSHQDKYQYWWLHGTESKYCIFQNFIFSNLV